MTRQQSMIVKLSAGYSAVVRAQSRRLDLIAEALKEGMTQRDVAFWSGVSRRIVSDIAKTVRSEQAASASQKY